MNRLYEPQYHLFGETQRKTHSRPLIKKIMAIGIIALVGFGILYFTHDTRPSIAEYLPTDTTLVYAEIPSALSQRASNLIKNIAPEFLDIPNLPMLAQSVGLAVIQIDVDSTLPLLFFIPTDEEARNQLVEIFTKNKSLVFSNDEFVLVADSENGKPSVDAIAAGKPTNPLSATNPFITAYDARGENPYFVFAQPTLNPHYFTGALASLAPIIPLNNELPQTLSAEFNFTEDTLVGTLITPHDQTASSHEVTFQKLQSGEPTYNAINLPLMPIDPDVFMGGASLTTLINYSLDSTPQLLEKLVQNYFPGMNYATDIEKLLTGEFAYALKRTPNGEGFIAAIELPQLAGANFEDRQNTLARLIMSYAEGLKTRAYSEQPFTLKDGTSAYEKILDPKRVALRKTQTDSTSTWTIDGGAQSLYVGLAGTTLFIANDESLLTQSMDRWVSNANNDSEDPREIGLSFRDGDMYKKALQPILKNPQLAASMRIKFSPDIKGVSSFSKHRFATTTETQFQFIFE